MIIYINEIFKNEKPQGIEYIKIDPCCGKLLSHIVEGNTVCLKDCSGISISAFTRDESNYGSEFINVNFCPYCGEAISIEKKTVKEGGK